MPSENISKVLKKSREITSTARSTISSIKSVLNNAGRIAGEIGTVIPPGARNQIGSVSFEPKQSDLKMTSSGKIKLESLGYDSSTRQVPEQYVVSIINSQGEIRALLQESISLRVTSEWVPFIRPEGIAAKLGALAQLITKKSLITRQTSRRVWQGTSPITISMTLKFEAYEDPQREVVRPCMRIQQMALPSEGEKTSGPFGFLPTLKPPGPSPFKIDQFKNLSKEDTSAIEKYLSDGDDISISIGSIVTFRPVIIKDAEVVFGTRLTSNGDPISATLNIVFETYEILTKEMLKTAYTIK